MSLKLNKFFLILILTSLSSTFSFLAIAFKYDLLKYFSVLLLILALLFSLGRIIKKLYLFNLTRVSIILILLFYPMLQIFYEFLQVLNFKTFTDGFIIKGGYYNLLIIALALVTFVNTVDLQKQLEKYILFSSPLIIILLFLCFSTPTDISINMGYLLFVNFLIPGALLIFFDSEKKYIILGWLSLILILYVSSYIASRSYTLVAFYIAISYFFINFKTNKRLFFISLFILFVSYYFNLFSFLSETGSLKGGGESLVERMDFDSLFKTINEFFDTFDFWVLFMWEGNSRATILIDAFKDFTLMDFLFGKGFFATYMSFIERSTIEIYWAQEIFRLGFIYTFFTLIVFIKASYNIVKNKNNFNINNKFFYVLSILVIVKILDAFIYGMPDTSIYNLFVFMAVASLTLKKTKNEDIKK